MESKIYHADWRTILKDYPNECVDGVFTDPPYNMDFKPRTKIHGQIANDALSEEESRQLFRETAIELYRLLKPNSVAWICCNWHCYGTFASELSDAGFEIETCVVWAKDNWGLGHHFRPQHEFILVAFKGKVPVPTQALSNLWMIGRHVRNIHPSEKPIALVQKALRQYNREGDVILDPYAGSFSTCVGAKLLGMRYIGIELYKKYFESGRDRLTNGVTQVVNGHGLSVTRSDGKPLLDLIYE